MSKLNNTPIDLSFIDASKLAVGLDEAGRGPLAGNVVSAAVIFPKNITLEKMGLTELTDSKKLTEKKRERLFPIIQKQALAWSIAWANPVEIDELNILQASLLSMTRSLQELPILAEQILVDGNKLPSVPKAWSSAQSYAIVKGDSLVPCISAASVLAKVTRDRQLMDLHEKYPNYGFAQHKGYPTKAHLAMLFEHGPCPEHRRSFAPVRKSLHDRI